MDKVLICKWLKLGVAPGKIIKHVACIISARAHLRTKACLLERQQCELSVQDCGWDTVLTSDGLYMDTLFRDFPSSSPFVPSKGLSRRSPVCVLTGQSVSAMFVGTILSTLKDEPLLGVYSHEIYKNREKKKWPEEGVLFTSSYMPSSRTQNMPERFVCAYCLILLCEKLKTHRISDVINYYNVYV